MLYLGINKKFILGLSSPPQGKKPKLVSSPNNKLVTEPFAVGVNEESKENLNLGDMSS